MRGKLHVVGENDYWEWVHMTFACSISCFQPQPMGDHPPPSPPSVTMVVTLACRTPPTVKLTFRRRSCRFRRSSRSRARRTPTGYPPPCRGRCTRTRKPVKSSYRRCRRRG